MSLKDMSPTELQQDWKSSANKRRIRGQIVSELAELISIHEDIRVAAHLVNILRSKGIVVGKRADGTPIYRDSYHLEDAVLLKEIEKYRETQDNSILETEDE